MKRYEVDGTVNKVPKRQVGTKQERAVRALVVQWRAQAEKLLASAERVRATKTEHPMAQGIQQVVREHAPRVEAAASQMLLCAEELEQALREREGQSRGEEG